MTEVTASRNDDGTITLRAGDLWSTFTDDAFEAASETLIERAAGFGKFEILQAMIALFRSEDGTVREGVDL